MLSVSKRFDLRVAAERANELFELLRSACDGMSVAGSIRRRCPSVKDIEFVVVPLPAVECGSLFEPSKRTADPFAQKRNMLDALVERLISEGRLEWDAELKRRGQRYKRLRFDGIPVDLFCVEADSFGLQLALRTGPADFSKRLVTQQWKQGWLPDDMRVADGKLWRVGQRVPVQTERAFFNAIELRYLEPERR